MVTSLRPKKEYGAASVSSFCWMSAVDLEAFEDGAILLWLAELSMRVEGCQNLHRNCGGASF